MKFHWDRIRLFAILACILCGVAGLVTAAWMLNTIAGVAALGGSLVFCGFFLAYLTEPVQGGKP